MLNKIHSIEYSSNQTVPKEAIELMKYSLNNSGDCSESRQKEAESVGAR